MKILLIVFVYAVMWAVCIGVLDAFLIIPFNTSAFIVILFHVLVVGLKLGILGDLLLGGSHSG